MFNPLSLLTVKKVTNYWGCAFQRNQLPKHRVGVKEKQTEWIWEDGEEIGDGVHNYQFVLVLTVHHT